MYAKEEEGEEEEESFSITFFLLAGRNNFMLSSILYHINIQLKKCEKFSTHNNKVVFRKIFKHTFRVMAHLIIYLSLLSLL